MAGSALWMLVTVLAVFGIARYKWMMVRGWDVERHLDADKTSANSAEAEAGLDSSPA